jgi:hypothetical protein
MRKRFVTAWMVVAVCGAAPLAAQRVTGRVVNMQDSSAVAGALVTLVDTAGRAVARGSTEPSGAYLLQARSGGRYVLRVLRIGQRPWQSDTLLLAAGAARTLLLAVPDLPIELPAITVAARSQCTLSPADTSLVGALLNEAEKALALAHATVDEGRMRYLVATWRRKRMLSGGTVDSSGGTALGHGWPVQSPPPESLRVFGFVRSEDPSGDAAAGPTYYGPDANVLFAPWFLESHCFSVSTNLPSDSDVAVEFRPASRGSAVDVAGRLVLARATLELRRLEFHYVGLARWVPTNEAGGWLRFQRLPTGAWLPVEWQLRAPIPGLDHDGHPWRLAGWAEFGGSALGLR